MNKLEKVDWSAIPAPEDDGAADHLRGMQLPSVSLTNAMNLPTFEVQGSILIKRLTLILEGGTIKHTIYPVFPPDTNAKMVIDWLRGKPS